MRIRLCGMLVFAAAISGSLLAQQPNIPGIRRVAGPRPGTATPPAPAEEKSPEDYGAPTEPLVFDGTNNPALKFDKAPSDLLLKTYADVTGKTLLIAPNVPKVEGITLRSQPGVMLDEREYLQAIEQVLVMNNIAFEPAGDKFLRVLPANEIRTLGIVTHFDEPAGGSYEENGKMVSQVVQLKNISIEEAKKVIEGFKRGAGQIQLIEHTNSIIITETVENVNRMMEILKYVDIPIENREETHVRPIKFAKAADIKKRLEEVIAEALKEQQQNKSVVESKNSGSPGMVRRDMAPPGVIRPRFGQPPQQPETPAAKANEIIETLVSDAERGVIRGKVQIVADERTNLLIFITRPENMTFFDRIIDVLDVEVQTVPDVIVNVFRLEYATAKDVATMLNDLIGNNDKKQTSDQDNPNLNTRRGDDSQRGGSSSLADAANRTRNTPPPAGGASSGGTGKLGELRKENVTILSDERSNAIIVMASPDDMRSVEAIIKQMDIQLSQVVIETVIVSVSFKNSQETGMDWVQRAMLGWTGDGKGPPTMAFATAGGGGTLSPQVTDGLTSTEGLGGIKGGGATGWLTFYDLNMDLVLKAVQSDTRARVMSSPRITTMDNKEAKLDATERIYWKEGTTYYSSSDYTSENIKNEDVGIKLAVTPRINKNGYITLTISQEVQSNEGYIDVTGNGSKFPQLVTRTMNADVAVQSGETVVLGGLAQNTLSKTTTKVPILGSIPLLGWFFRSEADESQRTEIIVFLTPRVIDTPAQMEDDARKIKASIETDGVWDPAWSNSRLADPLDMKRAKEVLKNGEDTVGAPRNPLSGYLTGLNDDSVTNAAVVEAKDRATAEGTIPYVHFTDMEAVPAAQPAEVSEQARRLSGVTFSETVVTNAAPAVPGDAATSATNAPPAGN